MRTKKQMKKRKKYRRLGDYSYRKSTILNVNNLNNYLNLMNMINSGGILLLSGNIKHFDDSTDSNNECLDPSMFISDSPEKDETLIQESKNEEIFHDDNNYEEKASSISDDEKMEEQTVNDLENKSESHSCNHVIVDDNENHSSHVCEAYHEYDSSYDSGYSHESSGGSYSSSSYSSCSDSDSFDCGCDYDCGD